MPRCSLDPSIQRLEIEGFSFPLGVYPVEPMQPRAGYRADFEPADGGEEAGQWEEWPDRYVYEVVVPSERLEPLVRSLLGLLPGRVYPILDILGHDAYREVDPYISYDLIGTDRIMDALRRYRPFFFEDGLCGFGAMSDEPFMYLFVDEHKIITVRIGTDHREKIDRVLAAFDLELVEEPAGADAAAHEHRGVLLTDENGELLNEDDITELLREEWRLVLNVDPEANVDDEGNELGITPWRCIVRCQADSGQQSRYADIVLMAGNLRRAEELALDAAEELAPTETGEWEEAVLLDCDRLDRETFAEWLKANFGEPATDSNSTDERIIYKQWIE